MRVALSAFAGIAAMLAACQSEPPAPEPETKAARRPPQPACDQARAELARRERRGAFLFEESGEAMTDRSTWMRLDQSSRDELIRTLAVVAACSTETPQHQVEVTIRDQNGAVLKSQQVEPTTDFRAP
jgi:hypothetical protein